MPLTVQQQDSSYNIHLNHTIFFVFFSITVSLCFPLSAPAHVCLCSVSALKSPALCESEQLSDSHFHCLYQNTESTCCYSSVSLFTKLIKPWCIKAHLSPKSNCWAVKCFGSIALHTEDDRGCRWAPLRDSTHDMHYPHNHYYFNKISFVFIKACLIVILHD